MNSHAAAAEKLLLDAAKNLESITQQMNEAVGKRGGIPMADVIACTNAQIGMAAALIELAKLRAGGQP